MKPIKVGITGGIGSGKSLVSSLFSHFGVPVYSADERAKQITAMDAEVRKEIALLLGEESLTSEGLNRAYVASRVFENKQLLARLNAIIHPAVAQDFQQWVSQQNTPFVLKEAAILFETKSHKELDKVILVVAPEEVRIQRVMKRDGLTREEVRSRIGNQLPDEVKIPLADYIIQNDGNQLLLPQVTEIYRDIVGFPT